MKNKLINVQLAALMLAGVLLAQISHAQTQLVYNNSTIDQSVRFNPGTNEIGDEITLAGTARGVKEFSFQYWGENFLGNDEQARVRFYKNDGVPSPQGALTPGTVLFDSDWFSIIQTNRATLVFTDFSADGGALVPLMAGLPDTFTWTVQFSGVFAGIGESAGVDLYGPPTVGGRFSDYWDRTASGWELRTNSGPPFPKLEIALSENLLFISWTNEPGGLDFGLQQTTNLAPTSMWSNVTNVPVVISGQYVVVLTNQIGNRFFRLTLPPPTEINFGATLTAVIQPKLEIVQTGNQIVLSWTNAPGGLDFGLQQTTNLAPTSVWSNVTNAPVAIGGQFVVTLAKQIGNRFFRLNLPP